jgi:formylmethanofuran dehydrogenase subunit E
MVTLNMTGRTDLKVGEVVNEWEVIEEVPTVGSTRQWRARCTHCGDERMLRSNALEDGYIPRCDFCVLAGLPSRVA